MSNMTPSFDLRKWREQFIRVVLRIAAVFGIVLIGVSFPTATATDRVLFIAMYILLLGVALLPTPYNLRAYFLLSMIIIVGVNAIVAWGPWADGNIFLLASIVLASLLLDNKTDIVLVIGCFVFMIVISFLNLSGSFSLRSPEAPEVSLATWRVYIADFFIVGSAITIAANMLKGAFSRVVNEMQATFQTLITERQNLEIKVQERTAELETRMQQLRASTTTAHAIAETQDIASLLRKAAGLIAERFEYYHVGIYILDEQRKTAYLQAVSSDTGKMLVGQGFRVEMDRKNPLAVVVEKKKTQITSDLERTNFFQDPNFPLTRSRMIIPLSVRNNLIGMIDIHSDQAAAFSQEDSEILQSLANLTAISFDNVRLLDETRNLLSQLETSASLQTQRTWSKFTSRHKSAYQYTPAGVRPIFSQSALSSDGLHIPVLLHGQAIGNIRLKKRKGTFKEWTERERELVEKISAQVALALENSRLVDEAQKNALRNQMIASFSAYVRETLDIESVIRTAATELRKVFDLKEAEIWIGPAQTDAGTQKN